MNQNNLESLLESLDTLVSKLEDEDIDLNTAIDSYGKALKETKTVLKGLVVSEKKLNELQKENEQLLSQLKLIDDVV